MKQDLAAVEAVLSSLSPAPSGLDRDGLMYLAGRASAGKSSPSARRRRADWLWPCTTAAMVLVAVTFATMWLARGGPEVVTHVVYVESDRPAKAQGQSEQQAVAIEVEVEVTAKRKELRTDYLQLRRPVLIHGVDAIPQPHPTPAADAGTPNWRSGDPDVLERLLDG